MPVVEHTDRDHPPSPRRSDGAEPAQPSAFEACARVQGRCRESGGGVSGATSHQSHSSAERSWCLDSQTQISCRIQSAGIAKVAVQHPEVNARPRPWAVMIEGLSVERRRSPRHDRGTGSVDGQVVPRAVTECKLAVALPGSRRPLRLRLPADAQLHRVFDYVAQETGQSQHDCAKDYQLQACASEPPHEIRHLSAADGTRTLSECGLVPQSAIALKSIAGSTPRGSVTNSMESVTAAPADPAEADRKAMELEKVEMFCTFTGADRRTAAAILARVDWVLESATNHFFEMGLERGEGIEDFGGMDTLEAPHPRRDQNAGTAAAGERESGPAVGSQPNTRGNAAENASPSPAPQPQQGSGAEQEISRELLSEGVTPPSGRDSWRTHDDQAKHLLHDWLAIGGLQSFADRWAEVGLDALDDFKEFWLAPPNPGSERWALLPEPRPRLFEVARARRLLAMIDAAAEAQGTDAPIPLALPEHAGGTTIEGATGPGGHSGSLSEWLSDAKLSEYEPVLVDKGGLVLGDIAYVTQEELMEIGVEKEFHRKRFLRMARR